MHRLCRGWHQPDRYSHHASAGGRTRTVRGAAGSAAHVPQHLDYFGILLELLERELVEVLAHTLKSQRPGAFTLCNSLGVDF